MADLIGGVKQHNSANMSILRLKASNSPVARCGGRKGLREAEKKQRWAFMHAQRLFFVGLDLLIGYVVDRHS